MLAAAKTVDRLGYSHLWTWDHLYAIFGDPYQPIFEGYSLLNAWARDRSGRGWACSSARTRSGTRASWQRSPRRSTTSSDGRAILGIGGAWMEPEHTAHGIDFGSGFGQRLDWLDESVGAMRALLDGKEVTSEPGGHYDFDHLRHSRRRSSRICRS